MRIKLSRKATQVHGASCLLGLLLAATTSCSAVAVSAGADAYDRNSDPERFEGRYTALNRSRRLAGKAPLDLCSERYWFERSWARKDGPCAARIRRYENGDSTALDPPEERLEGTTELVPDSVQRIYDQIEEKRLQQQWKTVFAIDDPSTNRCRLAEHPHAPKPLPRLHPAAQAVAERAEVNAVREKKGVEAAIKRARELAAW